MSQKTILLPIYNGIRAKNFFRSGTYPELIKDPNVKLVIVIPPSKFDFYKNIYKEPNVVFEPLEIISEPRFGRILSTIAFNVLDSDSVRLKQRWEYLKYGSHKRFIFKRALNIFFAKLPFTIWFIRFLDKFVKLDPGAVNLIDKYKPSMVIVPDIVFAPDRVFLRAAKRMKYPTVGMIRSWDNLTSKGAIQLLPDKLLVQTTIMKDLAIRYARMKPDNIIVTGIPQYDIFFQKPSMGRDEFFRSLGIDPKKKVILCTPFFDSYTGSAVVIMKEFLAAIADGRLPKDSHILVRYRPGDGEIPESEIPKSPFITVTRPCKLHFEVKNTQAPTDDWEFTDDDINLLLNTLRYSDVVVNTMSTLSVDATIYDRPVINIRFDADPQTPPKHSVTVFLKHDHYKSVEASGGVWRVWDMPELIKATDMYLRNPNLHSAGRERMRREQIEFMDGLSGKRVADYILRIMNHEA